MSLRGVDLRPARIAVSMVFAVHGAIYGSFATRIPWIAEHLQLGVGALGVALIAPALGAIAAMPAAARLTHSRRSRPTVRLLLVAWCASLVLPALAPNFALLVAALLIYGATSGMADVAMNAQGVVVEQRYGRSIMSGLHGLWSVGGLLGSGAGALAAYTGLDARVHFALVGAGLGVLGWYACRGLLDERLPGEPAPAFALPSRAALAVGLVGFCAVFAEGGSADWCAVYLQTVTGAEPGTAAIAFTAFAFVMAGGRLLGDRVIRRIGPVASVRAGGTVATAGGAVVLLARAPAVAIAGFALIGLGISVVVPLAFAAAASIGPNPSQAIAGVATIAYGSGLAAPGAIGGIAELSSLPASFGVVTALCALMIFGVGAMRPRGGVPQPGDALAHQSHRSG
jgi:predicted MFS family arabinose efflux permease